MTVSIIVPAYQEEKYIEDTLKAIKNQTCKDIELIVVCNGCKDKTPEIARKYADIVYETKKKGVSFARNMGAKLAREEILMFVDADTKLSKDVVERLVAVNKKMNAKKRRELVGTIKTVPDSEKFKDKILMGIYNVARHFKSSPQVIFCNKELFWKTGGFDEKMKIGYLGKYEDTSFVIAASKKGKFKYLNKACAITSTRRFRRMGIFQFYKHNVGLYLGKKGIDYFDE